MAAAVKTGELMYLCCSNSIYHISRLCVHQKTWLIIFSILLASPFRVVATENITNSQQPLSPGTDQNHHLSDNNNARHSIKNILTHDQLDYTANRLADQNSGIHKTAAQEASTIQTERLLTVKNNHVTDSINVTQQSEPNAIRATRLFHDSPAVTEAEQHESNTTTLVQNSIAESRHITRETKLSPSTTVTMTTKSPPGYSQHTTRSIRISDFTQSKSSVSGKMDETTSNSVTKQDIYKTHSMSSLLPGNGNNAVNSTELTDRGLQGTTATTVTVTDQTAEKDASHTNNKVYSQHPASSSSSETSPKQNPQYSSEVHTSQAIKLTTASSFPASTSQNTHDHTDSDSNGTNITSHRGLVNDISTPAVTIQTTTMPESPSPSTDDSLITTVTSEIDNSEITTEQGHTNDKVSMVTTESPTDEELTSHAKHSTTTAAMTTQINNQSIVMTTMSRLIITAAKSDPDVTTENDPKVTTVSKVTQHGDSSSAANTMPDSVTTVRMTASPRSSSHLDTAVTKETVVIETTDTVTEKRQTTSLPPITSTTEIMTQSKRPVSKTTVVMTTVAMTTATPTTKTTHEPGTTKSPKKPHLTVEISRANTPMSGSNKSSIIIQTTAFSSVTVNVTEEIQTVNSSLSSQSKMGAGAWTGIGMGVLIGFWIILGPIVCIICRTKDRAQERKERERSRDSMNQGLIEQMIFMELARGREKIYKTSLQDVNEIEKLNYTDIRDCEIRDYAYEDDSKV